MTFNVWDLGDRHEPAAELHEGAQEHRVVHRQQLSGADRPYEAELKAFLDGGGRLFMSGQDILDQAAGTTAFVHDYLHVDWDGSETRTTRRRTTSTASRATR